MDEAERCTRVGLIYDGKLIVDDTPANIKQIIPGHVLEFTPSAFAAALKLCTEMEGVLEVQTYGDKLHVFVDDVSKRNTQIEAALTSQGITHDSLREIEVRMEEAFITLIRQHQESVQLKGALPQKSEMPGGVR